MKRFVIKTVCIALPLLVVALALEVLLRIIPNDYTFKKNYLDNHSFEIETLILGSSHSFYGINPDYFSRKTFNASHISQSLVYDLAIVKKYEDRFENLKTVVLPISYFTLYGKLEAGPESWRIKNYMIYYGMNSSKLFTDYFEVLSNRLDVNVKRLLSYYVFGNPAVTCTESGWGVGYNSKNAQDLIESGKTAAQRHTIKDLHSAKYQEIVNDNIQTLKTIIQWCKERRVRILLLTTPAFETYLKHLNAKQYNTTIKTTRDICADYSNCKYLNLIDDTRFVSTDFFDADHLSDRGAQKLSKLIGDVIVGWE